MAEWQKEGPIEVFIDILFTIDLLYKYEIFYSF